MYSQTQKQELERIIPVFKNYIHDSEYLDLIWSEKIGYILLHINPPTQGLGQEPDVIENAESLCELLFTEISMDVLEMTHNEHSSSTADPLEKAEIQKRLEPFIAQLPKYRSLAVKVLSDAEG